MIFYQGGTINHGIHVTAPVDQSSTESEYNVACTLGMSLAHLSIIIDELLNNDIDIVAEEAPPIIQDIKSSVFMDKNGRDTKHKRHSSRRVYFVRNCENYKIHQIDWCEEGLQLADIATNNVGENHLNPRMKYIMLRLED